MESGITYLQPYIAKVGGVTKFLEILDLASKYKVTSLASTIDQTLPPYL
nr:hypothetical protein [Saccharolobus solfataricus]